MKNVLSIIILFVGSTLFAQSQKAELLRIMTAPVSENYQYNIGERVDFNVAVYKYGKLLKGVEIDYEIAKEAMQPEISSKVVLKTGNQVIKGIVLNEPGFVRLKITITYNGETYFNSATAGVEVDKIKTAVEMPSDFNQYWEKQIRRARKVDLQPELTRMPDMDNETNIAYHIRFKHVNKSYIYGMLYVPRADGTYPAVLRVPGAGVRSYNGNYTKEPIVSLEIGIHGIPVNLYDSDIYENLKRGALNKYYLSRMDDKDKYYYNRVYTACVRAIDFIHTLDKFDGENVAVTGGSQGGALTIVTAALDKRVDAIAAYYPALADVEGFLQDRAGGWPRLKDYKLDFNEARQETMRYYDVVNFARNLNVPGYYAYGYNDNVCPATSMAAMFNEIEAQKDVIVAYDVAHWMYPEVKETGKKWLFNYINVSGY